MKSHQSPARPGTTNFLACLPIQRCLGLAATALLLISGCDSDGGASSGSGGAGDGGVQAADGGTGEAIGSALEGSDSDGDGFTDAQEIELGTDPEVSDEGCAGSSATTNQSNLPVDVILIVDNSSSMDGEIAAIVERINVDFAQILQNSGVDYQLILLSRHGDIEHYQNSCDDHGICIGPPLASGTCESDEAPGNTQRFKHYSICINSEDGLRKAMDSFDGTESSRYFDADGEFVSLDTAPEGWRQWLRPGAQRSFLMITDDNSNVDADEFTSWMYDQDARYFGTAEEPNWKFHSIIGLAENAPEDAPWQPEDGRVNDRCGGGSEGNGRNYQDLSIDSGGLRFPICKNDNFDALFRSVATTVAEQSVVPCAFAPEPIPGQGTPDFGRVVVIYEAGDGTERNLDRVDDASGCNTGDYYVDGNQRIVLCPDRCDVISNDSGAALRTRVACGGEIIF